MPETLPVRLVGALGADVHPPATVNTSSFDGALVPNAFVATMRTKYVPGGALAENPVWFPRPKVPMSLRPLLDPACKE